MKRIFLLPVLALFLVSFSVYHKFYVSVSDVVYNPSSRTFQVTSRYFTDDMVSLLKERYDIEARYSPEIQDSVTDVYAEKYFREKFSITLKRNPLKISYIGREVSLDRVKFYFESEAVDPASLKEMTITNRMLFDLFEEQQNIVHIKVGALKKSFLLHKETDKALLNLDATTLQLSEK